MRRTYHFTLAAAIVAAPMPVAAQVSVDLNALNGLGPAGLPGPPPSAPLTVHHYHQRPRPIARAEREGGQAEPTAVASTGTAPPGPETIEHPGNLGPSFSSLPALPGAAPPAPPPPATVGGAVPSASRPPAATSKLAAKPAPPKPVEAALATPKPLPVSPPPAKPPAASSAVAPAAPALALPGAAPPPPPSVALPSPAPSPPTRLAETTPAPPAAQPAEAPPKAAPSALPKGADRLTLPFFVQESDLPPAENAMLRDFAQRHGADAEYVIRAFASPPAGDDDPSSPRRIALARAQSVAAGLMDSGVQPDRVRLLALGNAGGTPADRVEVIAMPPSSGHTNIDSSP